ncbi:MAG TPA: type II toxin-antitoxin system VapC family toxin [Caulobacteraceae bacterium]|nr:type II toxin-antitoxin system VapC family toxin [Caulobacteraceae bacterium]
MIAVDASAILAVVLKEDEAETFEGILSAASQSLISAVNYWEVLVRARVIRGAPMVALAEEFLRESNVLVAAVDADIARAAADAFARFGPRSKGGLNLGDCFAYALAAREGDGLLFKGDDFPKTDVKRVA